MADRATRQAYALAHPASDADDVLHPGLWALDTLPGGHLLRTCLAVDR